MPPFVIVENDRVYLDGHGCLTWHFEVMGGLYRVSRAESYSAFPPFERLLVYRVQDRHRLWQWLEDRERQLSRTALGQKIPSVIPSSPKPRIINPQYDPVNLEHCAKLHEKGEREKQQRADSLNKQRRERETGIDVDRRRRQALREESEYDYHWVSKACGSGVATFLSDHHYIVSMFDLYSQQRVRLL